MTDFKDIQIFKNKTFSDLLKEIYDNSRDKEKKIKSLINELQPLIKSPGDAIMLVPLIKEYLEISVKNDEHLIKMASIVQKAMNNSSSSSGNDFELSDKEKEDLLKISKELSDAA